MDEQPFCSKSQTLVPRTANAVHFIFTTIPIQKSRISVLLRKQKWDHRRREILIFFLKSDWTIGHLDLDVTWDSAQISRRILCPLWKALLVNRSSRHQLRSSLWPFRATSDVGQTRRRHPSPPTAVPSSVGPQAACRRFRMAHFFFQENSLLKTFQIKSSSYLILSYPRS